MSLRRQLTAGAGTLAASGTIGGEAGGAGHAGTLLLEATAECVYRALNSSHSGAGGVNGVVETGQLDCKHKYSRRA